MGSNVFEIQIQLLLTTMLLNTTFNLHVHVGLLTVVTSHLHVHVHRFGILVKFNIGITNNYYKTVFHLVYTLL